MTQQVVYFMSFRSKAKIGLLPGVRQNKHLQGFAIEVALRASNTLIAIRNLSSRDFGPPFCQRSRFEMAD
jgi:hypothetical protein